MGVDVHFDMNDINKTIVMAMAGGTVSKLTGGKFANGAVTAAIQFAVNQLQRKPQQNRVWNPKKRVFQELGSQLPAKNAKGEYIYDQNGDIASIYPGAGGQQEIATYGYENAAKTSCAAMQNQIGQVQILCINYVA
ncbi:hypothetical protein [Pseudoalteromonas luteoviolacea]|uniref:Uncharacterized protein n=1 Tax=Pseudoalteromonas luteoviolacea (strain 2ta16) TaxID=1353533 RepID=V4H9T8_PSEL2|nr:hypothetical protein [Pseudoalteromonas luteoviolacea]ESP94251.1 hypothetical protein PL2TA16_02096 [Pseudoalteromonas luteoviolacea 2ta16]KZN33695.1 hypothetical protein N483_26010 [Pseudoalteromonas luteoviolacea NCIMB 1944]